MKLRQLLEMPERIAQQELNFPWKAIDTTKTLFQSELWGSFPGMVLKGHPAKKGAGSQTAIVVYSEGKVIAGMIANLTTGRIAAVEVSGLLVAKSNRGSGIALSIYLTLAFNLGATVVSDDVQTPGGAAIWKKIAGMYPTKVGVTDGEVDEAIPLNDWTQDDPFTNHFTRFVLSKQDIQKQKQVA